MPKYQRADEATLALVKSVIGRFHERLTNPQIEIGVLFAYADRDEDTLEKKGPAIKHNGHMALGQVKIVSLKDRVTKGYDAEMLLDGDEWPEMPLAKRTALVDHELTHIRQTMNFDDLGRPKLKLRKDDFALTGFYEVIKRHGDNALERESVANVHAKATQMLMEFMGETEEVAEPKKRRAS